MLRKLGLVAALTTLAFLLMAGVIPAKVTKFDGLYVCDGDCPTAATSDGVGDVLVEGTLEVDGATDLDSTLAVAGASTLTGAVSVGSTLAVTGVTTLSAGIDAATLAAHLDQIRFCGNGPNATTATYVGPLLPWADLEGAGDTATHDQYVYGGTGCDAKDNTTEATAELVWHAAFAFKPVAMVCATDCGTDDVMTLQLRDDQADVAGMTCNITLAGAAAQCSVRDSTPATVAAGSKISVEVVNDTDDDCSSGDLECLLWVTY